MGEFGAARDPGARGRPGRRDRNRERLYAAALALFAERGYDTTTMDDVAGRAGLSRRSAFNHFPAKSDLTVEWTARRRTAALAVAGDGPGPDVVEHLRAWFRALGELTDRRPEETEQMTLGWLAAGGPARHPTGTAATLRPWLAAGVGDGALDAAVDPGLAAELLVDAYLGALYRWFRLPAGDRGPVTPRIEAAVELVLGGLLARSDGRHPPG